MTATTGPGLDFTYGVVAVTVYTVLERRGAPIILQRGIFSYALWLASAMWLLSPCAFGVFALFDVGDVSALLYPVPVYRNNVTSMFSVNGTFQ